MVAVGLPCVPCLACIPCQCNLDVNFGSVSEVPGPPPIDCRCGDCAALFNNTTYNLAHTQSMGGQSPPYYQCLNVSPASRYNGSFPTGYYCIWHLNFPGCHAPNIFLYQVYLSVWLGKNTVLNQDCLLLEVISANVPPTSASQLGQWYSQEVVSPLDGQANSFQCGATYHMLPMTSNLSGQACIPHCCVWGSGITIVANPAS